MPDIVASSDYLCYSIDYTGNWSATRDAPASDSVTNWQNGTGFAVMVIRDAGRGGGTFVVVRSFIKFNVSSVGSGDVGTASIKFTTLSYNNVGRIIAVKAASDGSNVAHFDDMPGFSAGSSMAGNVTDYSDVTIDPSAMSVGSTFSLSLNSTFISDMENNNSVVVGLVSYDYDYLNTIPTPTQIFARCGMRGLNQTDPPTLAYTKAGYGNQVSGIGNSNIAAIDGILTANIGTVIGV